jgi:hypothetical protein
MQEVLAGPSFLLAAVGPQNAGNGGAAEHQQRSQRLANRAHPTPFLSKNRLPRVNDFQPTL